MQSIVVVLNRLKTESKKDVTKTSLRRGEVDYEVVSLDLFGETYLIKKVSMGRFSKYKVGWVLDNQTKTCMRCDGSFSLVKWRHHCRLCGYLVCSNCSNKSLKLSILQEAELSSRVCKICYNTYSPVRQHQNKVITSSIDADKEIKNTDTVNHVPIEGSFIIGECSFNEDSFIVVNNTNIADDNTTLQPTKDTKVSNEIDPTSIISSDMVQPHSKNINTKSGLETDKLYVPKMRPQLGSIDTNNTQTNAIEESNNNALLQNPQSTTVNPISYLNLTGSTGNTAKTINDPSDQNRFQDNDYPKRKSLPDNNTLPLLSNNIISTNNSNNDKVSMGWIDNSIISTDTKTAVNTALNAIVTAPVPLYLPVSPEQAPNQIDMDSSPMTQSQGNITPDSSNYSPLSTDIEKFGTPVTRRIILEHAQSNVIWEAENDDDDSTSMGSATPRTGLTSKSSAIHSIQYHPNNLYANEFLHESKNMNTTTSQLSSDQVNDHSNQVIPKLTATALHDHQLNATINKNNPVSILKSTNNNIPGTDVPKTNSQLYQEEQIQAFLNNKSKQTSTVSTNEITNPTLNPNQQLQQQQPSNPTVTSSILPSSPGRLPLLRRLSSSNNRSLI